MSAREDLEASHLHLAAVSVETSRRARASRRKLNRQAPDLIRGKTPKKGIYRKTVMW
jgi:hypothetical protein